MDVILNDPDSYRDCEVKDPVLIQDVSLRKPSLNMTTLFNGNTQFGVSCRAPSGTYRQYFWNATCYKWASMVPASTLRYPKMLTGNKHLPNVILFLITIGLIALSFISYYRVNSLITAAELLSDSERAQLKISEVYTIVSHAQTAQRGYMLTADKEFLRPINKDQARVKQTIKELKALTRENTTQQLQIISLQWLVEKRFDLLYETLNDFQQGHSVGVLKLHLDNGGMLMHKIKVLTDEMISLEYKLLQEQLKANERFAFLPAYFSLYVSIILIMVVISASIFISFRNKELRQTKEKLEIANNKLANKNWQLEESSLMLQQSIQQVATKNIELQNIRVFLETVFDSSVDVIFTLDKDLNFISINSKAAQYFNRSQEEVLGNNIFDLFPDLKTSNREEFLRRALKGELIHVEKMDAVLRPGVILDVHYIPLVFEGEIEAVVSMSRDVTMRVRSTEALANLNHQLENKNSQLAKANAELSAFTYIASHDLQEPMRKINAFSSKLLELESQNLSDKGKFYFERIMSASSRMDALINALLEYSRLDSKKELVFAKTNLKDIINEVRKNLGDIIEEKDAKIKIGKLPALDIVPVQFSQLFANLIGNSIKYSKKDSPPQIKISSRLVKNLQLGNNEVQSNYWKISLTDNGIGFDPHHSENIFELFKRLHGKSEYSGTGIGLAICKKVVENHNGVIMATSQPGEGATFDIYIPETES